MAISRLVFEVCSCKQAHERIASINAQETEIKEVQRSYVEDFIASDYDGMTTHFTYPVMIMSSTTRILENPEALVNYYKSLISELPEDYSHSTAEVEVRKINNSTWILASIFYRYNTNGKSQKRFNFFE